MDTSVCGVETVSILLLLLWCGHAGAERSAGRGRAESDGYLYPAGGGPAVAMWHPAPHPPPPRLTWTVARTSVTSM